MSNLMRSILMTFVILAILAMIIVPFFVEGGDDFHTFLFLTFGLYTFLMVLWHSIRGLVKIWQPIYKDWRKKHEKT